MREKASPPIGCPVKRNGNMRRERGHRQRIALGMRWVVWGTMPGLVRIMVVGPIRWGVSVRICWLYDVYGTCGSGCRLLAPGLPRGADGRSAWVTGGDCRYRVVRGGSLSSAPRLLRSAIRELNPAKDRDADLGFRLAGRCLKSFLFTSLPPRSKEKNKTPARSPKDRSFVRKSTAVGMKDRRTKTVRTEVQFLRVKPDNKQSRRWK